MHFRTVASLEGEQLDALIVPVFKEGDAASAAPAVIRRQAEWVARESGQRKLFSAMTQLEQGADGTPTQLVIVAAGPRAEFDIQRGWQVVSAGVRALWPSNARRIGVVLDTSAFDSQTAAQSAVEGVIYAMWRPEAHRTGADERRLPPIDEVLLMVGARRAG